MRSGVVVLELHTKRDRLVNHKSRSVELVANSFVMPRNHVRIAFRLQLHAVLCLHIGKGLGFDLFRRISNRILPICNRPDDKPPLSGQADATACCDEPAISFCLSRANVGIIDVDIAPETVPVLIPLHGPDTVPRATMAIGADLPIVQLVVVIVVPRDHVEFSWFPPGASLNSLVHQSCAIGHPQLRAERIQRHCCPHAVLKVPRSLSGLLA
mmetsp:Transcript_119658/g.298426  ORF Transcript_119658/g.298426 Transcript_119658/m.298426 type:complete len:212 (+) Transcript_119658:449-1084(+)